MAAKLRITLLLLILSVVTAKGQFGFDYKEGWIITNDNDTLWGLVKDRGGIRNSKACFFKKDNENKREVFYPGDIRAYMIIGEKFYQSEELFIDNEYKNLFVEVLVKGKVDLLYYWNNKDRNFYIQKTDSLLINLSNEKIGLSPLKENINIPSHWHEYEVETQVYKDTLRSLFIDSRQVRNNLYNVKYNKKALINITESYIIETCGRDCIQYKKDLDIGRPQFGFYSGVSFNHINLLSDSIDEVNPKTGLLISNPIGVFYDLPITLLSDKLVLQTELNTSLISYSQQYNNLTGFNYIGVKYRQLGLVLMLKYEMFQNKLISPSIGFGKNTSFVVSSKVVIDDSDDYAAHFSQKGGWFFDIGAEYKLSPKFSLVSNIRFYSLNGLVVDNLNKRVNYNVLLADFYYPYEYSTTIGSLLIGLKF